MERYLIQAKAVVTWAENALSVCEALERDGSGLRRYFPLYESDLVHLECEVKSLGILLRAKLEELR